MTRTFDSLMPCEPWFTIDELCVKCGVIADEDKPVYERFMAMAVSYVFNRTGRVYGGACEYVLLPCKKSCCSDKNRCNSFDGALPFSPVVGADGVYNRCCVTSCCDVDDCSCVYGDKIRINHPNFVEVVEVVIDGTPLTADKFKVQYTPSGRVYLRRTDGERWPECQNLNVALGEIGSWHIKYRAGVKPRPDLVEATMLYAVELSKLCLGKKCALPDRYGVMADLGVVDYDIRRMVLDGLTGFTVLDTILFQINPMRLKRPVRLVRGRRGKD